MADDETLLFNDLGTEIVTICVGPQRTKFPIHKRPLCKKVDYFNKMFNGSFKEAEEATSYMPEDDPKIFSLFVRWLYYNDFPNPAKTVEPEKDTCEEDNILGLYLLAHKICLEIVADRCMDILIGFHKSVNWRLGEVQMVRAYENTSADSAIRRYCSKMAHWILVTKEHEEAGTMGWRQTLGKHEDMFTDLLVLLRHTNMKHITDPRMAPRCVYHVHGKDKPCPTATDSSK